MNATIPWLSLARCDRYLRGQAFVPQYHYDQTDDPCGKTTQH
jgi:hypothetical protein